MVEAVRVEGMRRRQLEAPGARSCTAAPANRRSRDAPWPSPDLGCMLPTAAWGRLPTSSAAALDGPTGSSLGSHCLHGNRDLKIRVGPRTESEVRVLL